MQHPLLPEATRMTARITIPLKAAAAIAVDASLVIPAGTGAHASDGGGMIGPFTGTTPGP